MFGFDFSLRYNISWAVDSHTPVEEFKLYFRRMPKGSANDEPNNLEIGYSEPFQLQGKQYGRRGLHVKVRLLFRFFQIFQ